mgnify:CR=1 FL=1
MEKLFIDAGRTGYTPDQCGTTLTVGDLIDILSIYDEDTPVFLRHDGGYTYGAITERDIEPAYDAESEE